jgi:hypothetical protein
VIEAKSPEVIFKYCLPEHAEDVWLHIHASDMWSLLYEIDQKCRSVVKYDDKASEDKVSFAEQIRELIRENIDLDKVT